MSRHIPRAALVVALLALGTALYASGAFGGSAEPAATDRPTGCDSEPIRLEMEVLREIPHDPRAFTQGLVFSDGELFESIGRLGESEIRRLNPDTGAVWDSEPLADDLFAEGLATSGDHLVQLTWTSGVAFKWVHGEGGFDEVGTWNYEGEGWGLTTDDSGNLLMSDGSDQIQIRDPESFEEVDALRVERAGGEVGELNELEYAEDRLWANQWTSDEIVRIRTDCEGTAAVDAVLDASALVQRAVSAHEADGDPGAEPPDVLNGIAYLGDSRYLLTGKLWPLMFEVEIGEATG